MTNRIRLLHRSSGGGGAGSPAAVAASGIVALNFDVGAGTPELWASDGSSWRRLNPSGAVTYATSAEVLAGTLTNVVLNPSVLAGASVLGISAGAGDASKYLRLNASGQIAVSVLPIATSAEVIAGTATDRLITPAALAGATTTTTAGAADAGKLVELNASGILDLSFFGSNAVNTSAGAADAGKLVRLDASGRVNNNMIDAATALEIQNNAGTGTVNGIVTDDRLAAASVKTFGSTADDGKLVRVTNTGRIDASLLPASAMEYRGTINPTLAANVPASPGVGDVYIISTAGAINAAFTGLSGRTGAVGDQIIYDGANWNLVQAANPDLSGYLPLAGTAGVTGAAMASGAVITMTPAAAGNTVFDGNGGALVEVVIDCGNY